MGYGLGTMVAKHSLQHCRICRGYAGLRSIPLINRSFEQILLSTQAKV